MSKKEDLNAIKYILADLLEAAPNRIESEQLREYFSTCEKGLALLDGAQFLRERFASNELKDIHSLSFEVESFDNFLAESIIVHHALDADGNNVDGFIDEYGENAISSHEDYQRLSPFGGLNNNPIQITRQDIESSPSNAQLLARIIPSDWEAIKNVFMQENRAPRIRPISQ